ncbi:hypothetical protein ACIP9H_26645 [Streptomyces sp. NPDC088732]
MPETARMSRRPVSGSRKPTEGGQLMGMLAEEPAAAIGPELGAGVSPGR